MTAIDDFFHDVTSMKPSTTSYIGIISMNSLMSHLTTYHLGSMGQLQLDIGRFFKCSSGRCKYDEGIHLIKLGSNYFTTSTADGVRTDDLYFAVSQSNDITYFSTAYDVAFNFKFVPV
jgi:hypothetical protein